jgi:CRISPR type III-A-associated RAMP protein Csm4
MNPGLVVKLRPAGPWRIGPDSGARNRVDVIYHSDSLYSAVTSAMSRLGSLEEWLDATARDVAPAVCFSSCFPFLDEIGFVTPPRTIWPPTSPALMSARVRWKSARFVPLGIVQALLAGQTLKENHWSVDGPSECLVPAGRPGPFRTGVRFNAAVDRLTGATERHSTACIEFRPGSGLWTIVSFRDDAARDRWSDPVKAAFRLLADTGFGGERSRGWGRSGTPEFIEGTLPEMILPPVVAVAKASVEAPPEIAPLEVEPVVAPLEPDAELEAVEPVVVSPAPDAELEAVEPLVVSPEPDAELEAVEPVVVPPEPDAELEAVEPLAVSPEPDAELKAVEPVVVPAPDAELEAAPLVAESEAAGGETTSATAEPRAERSIAEPEAEPVPEPEPVQQAEPQAPGSSHWLLSLFSPAASDAVDWRRGNYTMLARGGRIDSPVASGDLKKQLNMVAEGSVLSSASAPCGAAPNVAPDGFAHPVFRAGFAVAIPLPTHSEVS